MKAQRVFYLRGQTVQDVAESHHVRQADVAESLNISRSYWSQLCHRHRPLTPVVRQRILRSHFFRSLPESDIWEIVERKAGEP